MMGCLDGSFRPYVSETIENEVKQLIYNACFGLDVKLEAAQGLNCRLLDRMNAAEAQVAELKSELLLVKVERSQLGSDYRCVARKLREIAGAVPVNRERYDVIDGKVQRVDIIMQEANDVIEQARAKFDSCKELEDMEFFAEIEGPQLIITINRISKGRQAFMLIKVARSTWSSKDYDALPAMKSTAEKVRVLLEREIRERG